MILAPGEMSLHHVLICHGSEPNRADHRRVGFAIRYIAASVYQTSGVRESATLVRGTRRERTTSTTSCRPRPTFTPTR